MEIFLKVLIDSLNIIFLKFSEKFPSKNFQKFSIEILLKILSHKIFLFKQFKKNMRIIWNEAAPIWQMKKKIGDLTWIINKLFETYILHIHTESLKQPLKYIAIKLIISSLYVNAFNSIKFVDSILLCIFKIHTPHMNFCFITIFLHNSQKV